MHAPLRSTRSRAVTTARRAAVGLLALGAACASTSTTTRAGRAVLDAEVSRPDSVVLRVVNRSDHPVTISQVRRGHPSPLGAVSARGDARFALRAVDATRERMTLAATPTGDRTSVSSAPFDVQRGQVVVFLVAPHLVGSQVLVDYPAR